VLIFSAVVKLFVDSADPAEIAACVAAKGTRGVTTSAALVAEAAGRAGRAPADLLRAIAGAANGPVYVAVTAGDRDGMLREVREWAGTSDGVVATLPGTEAGIEVVRACAGERIRTGVGPCASAALALAAARAGAVTVASPVGRAGGVDGYDVIRKLAALFRTYEVRTEVVASEIRIPTDLIDAALAGAQAATAPGAVVRQLDAESSRIADGGG
jgi:transaldolase